MSLPQYLRYLVDDAYCFFTVGNKVMDSIRNKSICKQEVTGVCCRESSHHTERESGSLRQERKRNSFPCRYERHVELPRVRVCARSLVSDSLWPRGLGPPGSSVHGIFQAKILAWAAISYFRGSSQPRDWTCVFWVPCVGRHILFHCTTWEDHGTSWTRGQICRPQQWKCRVFTTGPIRKSWKRLL